MRSDNDAGSTYDDAFDRIVRQYYAKILAYCCYHLGGNRTAAEDCTQDIFSVLYGSIHKLRDYEKIGGWLYKTAANMTRRYAAALRKERRHVVEFPPYDMGEQPEMLPQSLIQEESFYFREEDDVDICARIETIMSQLSEDELAVWQLSFKEKRSIHEISATLKISESAAKSRVYRLQHKVVRLAHKVMADT